MSQQLQIIPQAPEPSQPVTLWSPYTGDELIQDWIAITLHLSRLGWIGDMTLANGRVVRSANVLNGEALERVVQWCIRSLEITANLAERANHRQYAMQYREIAARMQANDADPWRRLYCVRAYMSRDAMRKLVQHLESINP